MDEKLTTGPYYGSIYKALCAEMEAQGLQVRAEDAKAIVRLGFQLRAGMSWKILCQMLDVPASTFREWSTKENNKKKVQNGFTKW